MIWHEHLGWDNWKHFSEQLCELCKQSIYFNNLSNNIILLVLKPSYKIHLVNVWHSLLWESHFLCTIFNWRRPRRLYMSRSSQWNGLRALELKEARGCGLHILALESSIRLLFLAKIWELRKDCRRIQNILLLLAHFLLLRSPKVAKSWVHAIKGGRSIAKKLIPKSPFSSN